MKYLIGHQIEQYDIDALLGEGGMGTVYRATDLQNNRPVALKVMHPHLARQAQFQRRFLQESAAAARLDHPHIVKVYDSGSDGDLLYLVMERLGGGSLTAYLKQLNWNKQPMALPHLLAIGRQVAEALGHAHQNSIIHRDIKPDNILLRRSPLVNGARQELPEAVVTDFGLATLLAEDEEADTNPLMGSLPYMSPEQCAGAPLDGRSDIYALGIVLYQMATGQLPFEVRSLAEAVRQHLEVTPPKPSSHQPGLPAALDEIILRALAKKPENRYQKGEDLAAALRQLETKSSRPGATTAAAAGAALAVGFTAGGPHVATQLESNEWVAEAVVSRRIDANHTWTTQGDYRLLVAHKWERAEALGITRPIITIGRAEDNDVVLSDSTVSRHHASMERTPAGWQIVDLGSTNGTYLDGARLGESIAENWHNHQTVRVGPYFLQWQAFVDTRPAAASAAAIGLAGAAAATVINQQSGQSEAGAPLSANGSAASAMRFGPDQIGISLTPDEIEIAPGGQAQLTVELFNQSETVDHYYFRVDGLPSDWVTLPAGGIQLLPGMREQVQLLLNPPAASSTAAGERAFDVVVSSASSGKDLTSVAGHLYVTPFEEFEQEMHPTLLQEGDTGRVTITNKGNAPTRYFIEGRDSSGDLVFSFREPRGTPHYNFSGDQKQLTLAPGETAFVDFTIKPSLTKRLLFIRKKNYPFEVRLRTETQDWRELIGNVEIKPIISLGALLLLLVILLIGFLTVRAFQTRIANQQAALDAVAATSEAQGAVAAGTATAAALGFSARLATAAAEGGDALATVAFEATVSAIQQEDELAKISGTAEAAAAQGGDASAGAAGGAGGAGDAGGAGGDGAGGAGGDGAGGAAGAGGAGEGEGEAEPTAVPQNPPVAQPDSGATDENTALTVPGPGVLSNDTDPDTGDLLSITAFSETSTLGAVVSVNANGGYTYDPQASTTLQALAVGEEVLDTFTYTIEDGNGGTATGTVEITVSGRNDLPVAGEDAATAVEDTILTSDTGGLLANDYDPDTSDTLTVSAYDEASELGARVLVNTDGSYSYNPAGAPELNGLAAGETVFDSFTYTIEDPAGGTAIGTVKIIINGSNDAPNAANDSGLTNANQLLQSTTSLLDNDTDPDINDILVINDFTPTSTLGAVVAVGADGTFRYGPANAAALQALSAGQIVTDTFSYTIIDPTGASDTALVLIQVTGVNDEPGGQDDNYLTNEDTILSVPSPGVLANDGDIDLNEPLTVQLTSPNNRSDRYSVPVTMNPDGSFSYNPTNTAGLQQMAPGQIATDIFRYRVCDNPPNPEDQLCTGDINVNVIINGVNDAPVIISEPVLNATQCTLQQCTDYLYEIQAIEPDISGTTVLQSPTADPFFVVSAPGLPDWLTLEILAPPYTDDIIARLSGQPTQSDVGVHNITLLVEDAFGGADTQNFTINVLNANDAPVISEVAVTTIEDVPISFRQADFTDHYSDADGDPLQFITVIIPRVMRGQLKYGEEVILGSLEIPRENLNLLTYEPEANWFGATSFDWKASDGTLYSTDSRVSIEIFAVNDRPAFTSLPVETATQGTLYTYLVSTTDADLPADQLEITALTLPAWLTLADAPPPDPITYAAVLSGTPGQNDVGRVEITLRVEDAAGAFALQTFAITVANVPDPPVVTDFTKNGTEDFVVDFTRTDFTSHFSDIDGDALVDVRVDSLPGGGLLTLNNTPVTAGQVIPQSQLGNLKFAPTLNFNGITSFDWNASDGAFYALEPAQVNLVIAAVNDPPQFTSTPVTVATQNVLYEYAITATDPDIPIPGDTLNISATVLPSWLNLIDTGQGTATLSGIPSQNNVGVHNVTLRVQDTAGAFALQSFTITVEDVNDPPVVTDFAKTGIEDLTVNFARTDFTNHFSDPDGGSLVEVRIDALPPNGSLTLNNTPVTAGQVIPSAQLGNLKFTPNLNFNGSTGFDWNASDGSDYALQPAQANINITSVNDPPLFTSTPVTNGTQGVLYTYNIITTDPDIPVPGDTLNISAPTLPAWLNLVDTGLGTATLSGIPSQSNVGVHNVILRVEDTLGAFALQSFTITVVDANDPPVISDFTKAGPEDFILSFARTDFTNHFFDADGDSLANVRIESLPVTGTLTLNNIAVTLGQVIPSNQLGNLKFAPPANFNGSTSFDWNASDGINYALQTAQVNIVITPLNDPPLFVSTPIVIATQGVLYSYSVVASDADIPIPGDTLNITAPVLPAWLNLTDNGNGTATLSGTPGPNTSGQFNVTLRVEDSAGAFDLQSFAITIVAKPLLDLNGPNDPGEDFTTTFTEGGGAKLIVDSDLTITDPDSTDILTATVRLTNLQDGAAESLSADSLYAGIVISYDSNTGILSLVGQETLARYQNVLRTVRYNNTSESPNTLNRIVTFVVYDDTEAVSNEATATVNVVAVNDAPQIDLNGPNTPGRDYTTTFTEGNGPTLIVDPTLEVTDADHTNLQSATVTLTNRPDGTAESLSLTPAGSLTWSYNAGTGVLNLTGPGPILDFQSTLATVRYNNTSSNPNATNRTVTFIVTDPSGAASNTATATIVVVPVPNAPVLSIAQTSPPPTYTIGGPATTILQSVSISDADSTSLSSATVSLQPPFTNKEELAINTTGFSSRFSVTYDKNLGRLTLSTIGGPQPIGDFEQLLALTTYACTGNVNQCLNNVYRQINFVVNDGSANSNTAIAYVAIGNPPPPPPLLPPGGSGSPPGLSTNQPPLVDANGPAGGQNNSTTTTTSVPVLVAPQLTLSGPAGLRIASARLQIIQPDPNDSLVANIGSGIIAAYDRQAGTLTLFGPATVAQYQQALRSVRFVSSKAGTRFIRLWVSDGQANSAERLITITVNTGANRTGAIEANHGLALAGPPPGRERTPEQLPPGRSYA